MNTLPKKAGLGLRHLHYQEVIRTTPDVPWFEVHPENFFSAGGISQYVLREVSKHYPLSFHGVGMSLGSADRLSQSHLQQLKSLIDQFNPAQVSEHVSWSSIDGVFANDLLPLPFTEESLTVICRNIDEMQNYIGRKILVENPSTYIEFSHSSIPETEFLEQIAKRTGCGLLLDVNNIIVCSHNHNFSASDYAQDFPYRYVGEIHLAGHLEKPLKAGSLLIDHHGDHVAPNVWKLYADILQKTGPLPTLIEWDTNIPSFETLIAEMQQAQGYLEKLEKSHVA